MSGHAIIPYGRYVRLYTLHQLERPAAARDITQVIALRVRIETLCYSVAPLAGLPLDAVYAHDPREGAQVVREAVLPRLQTLLDARDPWDELRLLPGRDALWRQYAAARGLPAGPVRAPAIHAPVARPVLPARSRWGERFARAQHALELLQTAAETASALAALWQNWQLGREQQRLLAAQRLMLQDAIQAQIAAQDHTLSGGEDRDFVRGYLAERGRDPAYDAVFGADADPP